MSDTASKAQRPPGTETCGCCDGIMASTPSSILNRAGLSAISYRIGDYARFKESLHAGLSSSQWPQLAGLRTRDADDFTLGLIDAVSCAADVLTFYQERLANESYVRTATERVSLQEMAKLIGYRLRPGVAAETRLAFALEPPKAPPPNLPPDPGAFVTGIPTMLTLVAGLKVQSVPGQNEKPQTFETVEQIDARPEWNVLRPWMSELRNPGFGAKEAYLQGVRNNLKAGDALVLVDHAFLDHPTKNNNWDFRLIDTVDLDPANDRTHVQWQRPLGSVSPLSNPPAAPQAHVLRRRVAVFGHNAPMWLSMNSQLRGDYPGGSADKATVTEWPGFTISPADHAANANGGYVDTDVVLSEVRGGSLLVLAKGEFNRPDESFPSGTYVELYKVTGTAEVSRGEFAISGKVSRFALSGQNLDTQFFKFVRETSIFAQSEEIKLAPFPVVDDVIGDQLPLAIPADGLVAGRRLIIHGDRADGSGHLVHEATISSLAANANGVMLTIAPPLLAAFKRDTVIVHANVALATHGETVSQVLGAGDASKSFQRFELKRTPITYRSATNETGADSELTVRIGDIEWTEKSTLFGSGATERAYALTTDEQGKTWVMFSDGVHGARLPSGVNNVRTNYRQGLGKEGNVAADKLTQLMTRPLGLKSVSNPVAAESGTDPEPADQARRTMPLGTRTLGRAVSLLDYEDFAMAFTGIAKAQARVLQLAGGPTIAITVAGQDGTVLSTTNPVWTNLLLALKNSGDPYVWVALLPHQASTFRLGLKVKRDPAYELKPLLAAVEAALHAHFSFDARSLAQPVLQSDVIAAAHTVPGVVAVDLDFLYGGTVPYAQTLPSRQTRLLASRMQVSGGVALPAELLTLDPAPFDRLEEMT
ncbi:MAG: baseplate J/gp47 family protein [Betaproteobacteria bacterium]|nr:baseplate J/gp47 family protein [Betaproteobacteria bacterium]